MIVGWGVIFNAVQWTGAEAGAYSNRGLSGEMNQSFCVFDRLIFRSWTVSSVVIALLIVIWAWLHQLLSHNHNHSQHITYCLAGFTSCGPGNLRVTLLLQLMNFQGTISRGRWWKQPSRRRTARYCWHFCPSHVHASHNVLFRLNVACFYQNSLISQFKSTVKIKGLEY